MNLISLGFALAVVYFLDAEAEADAVGAVGLVDVFDLVRVEVAFLAVVLLFMLENYFAIFDVDTSQFWGCILTCYYLRTEASNSSENLLLLLSGYLIVLSQRGMRTHCPSTLIPLVRKSCQFPGLRVDGPNLTTKPKTTSISRNR